MISDESFKYLLIRITNSAKYALIIQDLFLIATNKLFSVGLHVTRDHILFSQNVWIHPMALAGIVISTLGVAMRSALASSVTKLSCIITRT